MVMFKRQVIQELGAFRLDVSPSEDQEIFLRIARIYPIYCHHEIIAEHRLAWCTKFSEDYDIMLRDSLKMLRLQREYARMQSRL